jgi:prepilin-type N-terminal cleavage/methylation domain-containing protein
MMLRVRQQRGMTLVEVMISLTIITLMVGMVTGTLANYLMVTATARNTVEIVGAHERVLRRIRDELCQSSANRFNPQWWIEDGGQTLRLRKLSGFALNPKGNPSLTWSSDIVFSLNDNGVVTREQDSSTTDIAGRITELEFTEIPDGRVQVKLTNQIGSEERNTLSTLSTTIEITPLN